MYRMQEMYKRWEVGKKKKRKRKRKKKSGWLEEIVRNAEADHTRQC